MKNVLIKIIGVASLVTFCLVVDHAILKGLLWLFGWLTNHPQISIGGL